jgi:hypothetical protein
MIMTYLAVLLYTLLFAKPKQHVIEIIYGRGKFVGDFDMGRGKFVGDFNMGNGWNFFLFPPFMEKTVIVT